MAEEIKIEGLEKAAPFFDRAKQVAATDNFDYAIDMYIEGLRRAPDALEQGHKPLRHNALIRQGKGGKKPSMMEKLKKSRDTKNPLENMLNAEYLLAKDPDNLGYAQSMLKAAIAAECRNSALWIADLIFSAARASEKPAADAFILLKDSYSTLEAFDKAVAACQQAVKLKPSDGALADELRNLSANMTMQRGKYDASGDFRKSIKDKDAQQKLQQAESVVKNADYKLSAVQDALLAVQKEPGSAKTIIALADALFAVGDEKSLSEAFSVLAAGYEKTKDFSLKRHEGQLKIKNLREVARQAKTALEAEPKNDDARSRLASASKELLKAELVHYQLCVENYPTDLGLKYEFGSRLLRAKQFDEAIPMFQEARKDPRHKIAAMDKLGVCFFMKEWFTDAIDIFNEAIKTHPIEDDSIGKELRYNLARAQESAGQTDKALELYRKLAQIDFSYKDVKQRVDKLRNSG